jgi:hypothetical protein
MEINGESIYDSRPWQVNQQGKNIFFTRSKDGKTIYIICTAWPGEELKLHSLQLKENTVIEMLGARDAAKITWKQGEYLTIYIPELLQAEENRPCQHAWVFKAEVLPPAEPPQIMVADNRFSDAGIKLCMYSPTKDARIYYTTDESEPTCQSLLYTEPIILKQTGSVHAITVKDSMSPSKMYHNYFVTAAEAFDAEVITKPRKNGIAFEYYEAKGLENLWNALPDFNKLSPVHTGVAKSFTLDLKGDGWQSLPGDFFALRFAGFIQIEKDGYYTFYTKSDDCSRLTIDEETIVDNNFLQFRYAPIEITGATVPLRAGLHKIVLEYFEKETGEFLEVSYEGPGIAKQPIPSSILFH